MNDYASLRQSNKSRLTAVAALALCVILSASMLCSRLLVYTPLSKCQYIPLTQSNGITRVTRSGQLQAPLGGPVLLAAKPLYLASSPGFEVHDKNTVWSGETNVEIFSIKYDNASGETTVRSRDGAKVLAPGTGSTYEFALENTGNVSLDYTLEMDAWFSDTEHPIPIVASVVGHEGDYLLGSAEEMVDVLRLKEVKQSGTIARGNIMPFSLNWEWPFEQDDAYDTMLGNLAVEEDITLTIVIKTTATCNEDPQKPGGVNPQTGDSFQIELYATLMVASLAGILALLLLRSKEEKNETA